MALTQIDDRGLKTPIDLIDNEKIRLGTGNDFELYHDGSNSYIKDTGTGNLYIFSENLRIENADGSESYIEANNGGNVELFWDGSKKLETTQYGAKISTNLSAGYLEVSTTGNLGDGHIEIKGGEGGGSILSLTADEGDDNADYWRIQNAGDNLLGFRSKESGSWVEKFRIQSDGRVQIPNDTGKYECGSSGDLQIYHNGTDSFVKTITGNLKLFVGNEQALIAKPNGAVELYFDDAKKLETKAEGIAIQSGQRECNLTLANDALTWKIVNYDYGNNGTDHLGFHDGTADRLIIHDTGDGISFNGDTAAANALGDYEYGSWTPSFNALSTGSITTNYAKYVKVGHLVHVTFYVSISSGSTNNFEMSMPFANSNANGSWNPITLQRSASSVDICVGRVQENSTTLIIPTAVGDTALTYANLNGQWVIAAGTYMTDT